jgi:putative ABC transport system permease protein
VLSLLTESLLLSLIGGLLGLILAKESLPLIRMLWPANLPLIATLSIDWRVILFTLAVGVFSPLLFGLTPALKLSSANIAQVLAKASRFATWSNESVRVVRLLVFAQIALAVMLVSGTVLMARSLLSLYSTPLGFNPVDLVVGQVSLASERYNTSRSTEQLLDPALRQLQALPGVQAAAAMDGLPLERSLNLRFHPVDAPSVPDHDDEYRPVTIDFFRTLQIPLLSGRLFTASDFSGGAPVAIVNETMARRWWPGAQAIGHYIQVDKELGPQFADVPRQVVGVVADVHEKGPDLPPPTAVYIPLSQTPDHINAFSNKTFLTSIVVRASGEIDLSNETRNALQTIDPALPLASSRRFSQVIDGSLATRRFIALLTAAFTVFALVLAAVGIHSVLNYQARLRAREIAIRMAVGASRGRTLRMVMQQGARLILPAVLAGLAGSFLVRILLGKLLYNAQDNSIVLMLGAGVLLGLVAMLISLQAAMRAASIDPMAVLRNE